MSYLTTDYFTKDYFTADYFTGGVGAVVTYEWDEIYAAIVARIAAQVPDVAEVYRGTQRSKKRLFPRVRVFAPNASSTRFSDDRYPSHDGILFYADMVVESFTISGVSGAESSAAASDLVQQVREAFRYTRQVDHPLVTSVIVLRVEAEEQFPRMDSRWRRYQQPIVRTKWFCLKARG